MPHPDPRTQDARFTAPTDELVLAAIERAERHQAPASIGGARVGDPRTPRAGAALSARAPRPRPAGRIAGRRLARMRAPPRRRDVGTHQRRSPPRAPRGARRRGCCALPESPQHRAWRNARTAAAQELERFQRLLRERLEHATALLDAEPPPHSDAWLELAEELQRACRRLASASHCLYEWAEPDDARADIDTHDEAGDRRLAPAQRRLMRARRAGRRNIRLWGERESG